MARHRASRRGRILLAVAAIFLFAAFASLGVWQLERRSWKLALIARVDARVHAPPVSAPGPDEWPAISARRDGYLHVRLTGTYLNDRETLVYAVTDLGPGDWVMTPLKRTDGTFVLVNRGFVTTDRRDPATRAKVEGPTTVTGLLRMSEPKGAWLRANRPSENRWYSRDVKAIAKARGLDPARVAPYFVDADAGLHAGRWPVGGLTRVHFRNAHLQYALTWFAMALLVIVGTVVFIRHGQRDGEGDGQPTRD